VIPFSSSIIPSYSHFWDSSLTFTTGKGNYSNFVIHLDFREKRAAW
jgi:hypothetical protein